MSILQLLMALEQIQLTCSEYDLYEVAKEGF